MDVSEGEIKAAFAKAVAVRAKGPEVSEMAALYFPETLIRVHRAGEGAPCTGIKDEPVEPIVTMSDKALPTVPRMICRGPSRRHHSSRWS
jgi:hypothetical protein